MGSDDLFKKRRAARKQRQHEYKMPRALHFNYSDAALHRHQWNEKLDELFRQNHLGNGTYQKNYENIYEIVDIYDGVNTAVKNAKRRMAEYDKGAHKPSEYDPGTTVYQLVEALRGYLV